MRWSAIFLVLAFGCGEASLAPAPTVDPLAGDANTDDTDSSDVDGVVDAGGKDPARSDAGPGGTSNLRILAGNISSGPKSTYDTGEGIRILKGLGPDVALLQELNYKTNSKADLDAFVDEAFGSGFEYYREEGASVQIPNGVVSRYPIVRSGRFVDPKVANRGFAYAQIDVPGPRDLWAVSVHLLTTSPANRNDEATSLVAQLGGVVGDDDFVVIGGDFNTDTPTEPCLTTFGQILDTNAAQPVDQKGNGFTNAPRTRPYDWVLPAPGLGALQVPTVIGANQFPSGLVFDSRVYTPLADVAPVMKMDSDAVNMQHMAIVKDFALPN